MKMDNEATKTKMDFQFKFHYLYILYKSFPSANTFLFSFTHKFVYMP